MGRLRAVAAAAGMGWCLALSAGSAAAFDQGDLIQPIDKKLTFVVVPKVVHPWYDVVKAGADHAVTHHDDGVAAGAGLAAHCLLPVPCLLVGLRRG